MREAIGGIPIFQIVVVFILLFTGIMCLTINRSKAFGVKDEIITIIETESNGSASFTLDEHVNSLIAEQLKTVGYRTTGTCPEGYKGYNRDGGDASNNNAAYCIRINQVDSVFYKDAQDKCSNSKCKPTSNDFPGMAYYDIILFYQLDIPIVREMFNFKVTGSTKLLFK